jgi:HAD superfamily hydrolase (TIGR01509 family)
VFDGPARPRKACPGKARFRGRGMPLADPEQEGSTTVSAQRGGHAMHDVQLQEKGRLVRAVEGIVFDVDGTLVDSNDAHARAWVEALAEAGHAVPFERVRPLIGMGGDKLLPAAAGLAAESAEGEAIGRRRGEIFRERHLPHLTAFAGARELLRTLRAHGFRLGVASSAEEADLAPLLRLAGADDLLHARTSGDEAESSKPDPDILVAALRELGCAPADAVMIGDTPYDMEAASRTHLRAFGFRCGGWDDRALQGAVAIYDGPEDLLRRLESSPLFRIAP